MGSSDGENVKMDLFAHTLDPRENLLPRDGEVNYYGPILSLEASDHYLSTLLENIAWKPDEAIVMGKHIFTKRCAAWYADSPFQYTYSRITKHALPWAPDLLDLKARVEQVSGEHFNSCLLNLYHDGSEGMAWHSDAEKDLKKDGAISSLSFGAVRKFSFKHKKEKRTVSLMLNHGSLLVMKGAIQTHWVHRLPPTKTIQSPRVNLTFRMIVNNSRDTP